jgi:hypothetical protein
MNKKILHWRYVLIKNYLLDIIYKSFRGTCSFKKASLRATSFLMDKKYSFRLTISFKPEILKYSF